MTKTQIEKRVRYYQDLFGLQNWDIKIFFDLKKKSNRETSNFVTAARTESEPEYKMASISFNPKELHTMDDETIIHELLHVIFAHLIGSVCTKCTKRVEYYHESTVAELSRILLRIKK